jgi:hypothetical protein
MFRVVKFDLLLKYTVLATVGISILLYSLFQNWWFPNWPLPKVSTISSTVSAVLMFILLTPYFSRKIWALIGVFNKALFPDLNGTWQGKITLENEDEIGVRCVIRQSLLAMQIDMHGETMKSITLETTPTVEQGQNKLYYVYRCSPKDPARPSYNGSTLFDIRVLEDNNKKTLELSGHYYTDRKTIGRIKLRQVCSDSNKDVSYY